METPSLHSGQSLKNRGCEAQGSLRFTQKTRGAILSESDVYVFMASSDQDVQMVTTLSCPDDMKVYIPV